MPGFGDVLVDPPLIYRVDDIFGIGVTGNDHAYDIGIGVAYPLGKLDARHMRHTLIAQ